MALFGLLGKKKEEKKAGVAPILPLEIFELGALELRDIIAPAALKVTPRILHLGDKLARTFYVISYPRILSSEWFSPVINLDKVFDVSVFVHPIDSSLALRQLERKVAEVQSQISLREEKGLVRDPLLDTAYEDIENLRDALQQAREKIFDLAVYVTIYGGSEDELDKTEREIKGILDAKLVYIKPSLFQQAEGFRSVLPVAQDELNITYKLNSAPLSSVFPFVSFDLTSNKGILYGINRHNSSLILFDRFSLENYNSVIFAQSGAGKSIRGDEPVLVRRQGTTRLVPIGQLVEREIKKYGCTKIDEELEGVVNPGIEVFSFDQQLKGRWGEVSIAARKPAPDTFYTFRTKSGRSVVTTADHNMLVLRAGRVGAAKSAEIKIGESVPLPRLITGANDRLPDHLNLMELWGHPTFRRLYLLGADRIITNYYDQLMNTVIDPRYDRYLYKYRDGRRIPLPYFQKLMDKLGLTPQSPELKECLLTSASGQSRLPLYLALTPALLKIFGYITAEGTVTPRAVLITNTDPEVRTDIAASLAALNIHYFETEMNIVVSERPFIALTRCLGLAKKSGSKRVPPIVFGAPQDSIATFLAAYFEGDGGADGQAVTAVSKSRDLISDLSYLLYFFGIVGRIGVRWKMISSTRRRRKYWMLSISGQPNLERFTNLINFISTRKQQALAALKRQGNTNVDTIPDLPPLLDELNQLFGSQLHSLPAFHALRRGIYQPSPTQLASLIETIEQRLHQFEALEPTIDKVANLPTLETVIRQADHDRALNHELWATLGSSWAVMKKRGAETGSQNSLRALDTIGHADLPSLAEVKATVLTGFHALDLSIKSFQPSIKHLASRPAESDISYRTLQSAAQFINTQYQEIKAGLPRVRAIVAALCNLAKADLFWDPIVKIEQQQNRNEKYVYDLTVDNEVFLAGRGGLFIHNSYATKLEILRSLMFDTDIIVIDPEREYEFLSEAVGGRYFNISLTSEHHINPFDLPFPREDESSADVLRSHIINLVGLFRLMLGGLTPEEDALIDHAITETYALKDITADSDFANKPPPLLSDLELVLVSMEGGESLAQRLLKYTRGTWAGFINRPTNVDINKKFVVFSVRDMEDELKPVAMHIVMNFIWGTIRHHLKKRLLVIDEAWWMMKAKETASFLFSLVKRGRKYFLGVATITQDVGDFLHSDYGLPIITNSALLLLLKQSPASIDLVQKTFNLTDEEKYLLLEAAVGEGIFFAGLKHVAAKIIASYTEDQIITSDPSQILAIKQAKKSLEEANG